MEWAWVHARGVGRDRDGGYGADWEPALALSNSLASRLNLQALLTIQIIQMMAKRRIRNQWAISTLHK